MRLLGPAAKIVQAVTTAVTPVLAAVRPRPTRRIDPWLSVDAHHEAVNQAHQDAQSWLGGRRPDWLRSGRPWW